MGTKIIRAFKFICLIVLAYFLMFFGARLILAIAFSAPIKWALIRDVLIPALGCYYISKDLFVIKWKEKGVLQNGENQ